MCTLLNQSTCKPTIVAGPNPNEYTFDDGFGNTSVINVNEIDHKSFMEPVMKLTCLVVQGPKPHTVNEPAST